MHCPNCGKQSQLEQKFCRSCGMKLELVSEALAGHLAQAGETKPASKDGERVILRRMARTMTWGCELFLAGLLLVSVSKIFMLGRWALLSGMLLLFAGMGLAAQALFTAMRSRAELPRPTAQADALEAAGTTEKLLREGSPAVASSVAERTTELLGVETKKNSRAGRG